MMEWLERDISSLQIKIDDFKRRKEPYIEQMNALNIMICELEEKLRLSEQKIKNYENIKKRIQEYQQNKKVFKKKALIHSLKILGLIVSASLICLVPLSYFVDIFAHFLVGLVALIPLIEAVIYTHLLEKEEKPYRYFDNIDEEELEKILQDEYKKIESLKDRLFDKKCQYEALEDFVKDMYADMRPLLDKLDVLIEHGQVQTEALGNNKARVLERK